MAATPRSRRLRIASRRKPRSSLMPSKRRTRQPGYGFRDGTRRALTEPRSGCEQLRVEPLAQLARLPSLGLDEVVPEDGAQLRRRLFEQPFGRRRARLDLEPRLRRTCRELELVPGEVEAVQAVLVPVLGAAIAQRADRHQSRALGETA